MLTPILDHNTQALARLLARFRSATLLQNVVSVIAGRAQLLEGVLDTYEILTAIATATGVNLDGIGQIVGLARTPGQTDASYRMDLYAQIKVNTSFGTPEQVIQTFSLLTAAAQIIFLEFFPAEVQLQSEYHPPDQATTDLILDVLGEVLGAAIRPHGLVAFDATSAFSYDGPLPGQGYGSTANALQGGKYPFFYTHSGAFAYAGTDPTALGYGSIFDSLIGGRYAS